MTDCNHCFCTAQLTYPVQYVCCLCGEKKSSSRPHPTTGH